MVWRIKKDKRSSEEKGWAVHAVLSIHGPKEGPVVFEAHLPNTTKENALRVQEEGLQALRAINES